MQLAELVRDLPVVDLQPDDVLVRELSGEPVRPRAPFS